MTASKLIARNQPMFKQLSNRHCTPKGVRNSKTCAIYKHRTPTE